MSTDLKYKVCRFLSKFCFKIRIYIIRQDSAPKISLAEAFKAARKYVLGFRVRRAKKRCHFTIKTRILFYIWDLWRT